MFKKKHVLIVKCLAKEISIHIFTYLHVEVRERQLKRFQLADLYCRGMDERKWYFGKRRLFNTLWRFILTIVKTLLVTVVQASIAYFPLVVLVTGVVASSTVKPLNKRLGSKVSVNLRVLVVGCQVISRLI